VRDRGTQGEEMEIEDAVMLVGKVNVVQAGGATSLFSVPVLLPAAQ